MNTAAILTTTLGLAYCAGVVLAYIGCMVWALDAHLDGFDDQLRRSRRRGKVWPLAQLCGHCVLFITLWPLAGAIILYHVGQDWFCRVRS